MKSGHNFSVFEDQAPERLNHNSTGRLMSEGAYKRGGLYPRGLRPEYKKRLFKTRYNSAAGF